MRELVASQELGERKLLPFLPSFPPPSPSPTLSIKAMEGHREKVARKQALLETKHYRTLIFNFPASGLRKCISVDATQSMVLYYGSESRLRYDPWGVL